MCVPLRSCCGCLSLELGCVVIAAFMIIYRLLMLLTLVDFGEDADWSVYSDSTISIIFMLIGIIIPVILLAGVCMGSSTCLLLFVILEAIWLILFFGWLLFTHWDGSESEEAYDDGDTYGYETQQNVWDGYTYTDYDADDDDDDDGGDDGDEDDGKIKKAYNSVKNFFKKHWWIIPLILLCTSCYFRYVAYSLYRYWREEDYYYEYDEPTYYYSYDHSYY